MSAAEDEHLPGAPAGSSGAAAPLPVVLVVDDEPRSLQTITRVLEDEFDVLTATGSAEADSEGSSGCGFGCFLAALSAARVASRAASAGWL